MGKATTPRRTRGASEGARARPVGHSRAGRPRKEGERYDNGRLKPTGPNLRVVEMRRSLLGDGEARGAALRAAENPLDLMLARGWIDQDAKDAGRTFARLHAEARMTLAPVRVSQLETRVRTAPNLRVEPMALWRLSEVWRALEGQTAAVNALVEVCVLEAWPAWLIAAATTRDVAARAVFLGHPQRTLLNEGLEVVAQTLRRPPPKDLSQVRDQSRFIAWLRRI